MRIREIQNAGTHSVQDLAQVDVRDLKHVLSLSLDVQTENRYSAQNGSILAKWVHGRN